mgnify:CR=1 FL=1
MNKRKYNKKKYRWITEASFRQIKALLEAGVNPTQIKAITGKAFSTTSRIKMSDSFGKYQKITRELTNAYRPVTRTPSSKISLTGEFVKIHEALNNIEVALGER